MTTREQTIICDYLDQINEDVDLLNKQYEETKQEHERKFIQKRYHELLTIDEGIVNLITKLGYRIGLNDNNKHIIFK